MSAGPLGAQRASQTPDGDLRASSDAPSRSAADLRRAAKSQPGRVEGRGLRGLEGLLSPFARKLARLGVSSDSAAAILSALGGFERLPAERTIAAETGTAEVMVLLDGLAARCKLGVDGERQILAFCVPGDLCAGHLGAAASDQMVATVSACTVGRIPRRVLLDLQGDPTLARAMWRDAMSEGAIAREWLFNIGRRNAPARLAHLLCELHVRSGQAAGVTAPAQVLSVSQRDLADATGLSVVHVNRHLKTFCREGVISVRRREVRVLDPATLARAGGFEPSYLRSAA